MTCVRTARTFCLRESPCFPEDGRGFRSLPLGTHCGYGPGKKMRVLSREKRGLREDCSISWRCSCHDRDINLRSPRGVTSRAARTRRSGRACEAACVASEARFIVPESCRMPMRTTSSIVHSSMVYDNNSLGINAACSPRPECHLLYQIKTLVNQSNIH